MRILNLNKKNFNKVINETIKTLKSSGLVIYPTDTVYGALVDAKNEKAVKKLISFKNRPWGKPISVFTSDWDMLKDLVDINSNQEKILKEILPGCFTVVLKSKGKVSSLLESEKKTLGVRLVRYKPLTDLLKKISKPLTATSANLSGRSPHYSVESLIKQLPNSKKQLIDLIIDGGKLPRNKPSTVIDLTGSEVKILRQGDIEFLKTEKKYISQSVEETKKIAEDLIKKAFPFVFNKPLVVLIEGELGVGKTVFVQGIGNFLGIRDIISPSYVIYYEYKIEKPELNQIDFKNKPTLYHFDLYSLEDKSDWQNLKIKSLLVKRNILVFEWGEKISEIFDLVSRKSKIIYVKMEYFDDKKRRIIIKS